MEAKPKSVKLVNFEEETLASGRKADNCIIVCSECYREIGQDGTKTIPFSELPCYKVF